MTPFQALILGIVQGITEFLPVSSSGHLVIVPALLGWEIPTSDVFVFDVLVQMGTLLALIVYYWRDLLGIAQAVLRGISQRQPFADPAARLGWLIVLATIPAGLMGFVFNEFFRRTYDNPQTTAIFFLLTAGLLGLAEWLGRRSRNLATLTWRDALWIGAFQILALFPGVSRSGSTIAGGMVRDLERPAAARFAFLMSVPVMLGAGLYTARELPGTSVSFGPALLVGFLAAAVVGFLAIHWLLHFLANRRLTAFIVYLVIVSAFSLFLL